MFKLKIENHTVGANSAETDVKTTVANQWETLIFDLSNTASGTPALILLTNTTRLPYFSTLATSAMAKLITGMISGFYNRQTYL